MWTALKKLMTLIKEYGFSLETLIKMLQDLVSLELPPPVEMEKEFRDWVCSVMHKLVGMADYTPTPIDDAVLQMIDNAIEDDAIWPLIYKLITMVFQRDTIMVRASAAHYGPADEFAVTQGEVKVAADILSACDPGVAQPGDEAEHLKVSSINPVHVVMLISTLVELYKTVFKKKDDCCDDAPQGFRPKDDALDAYQSPPADES